MIVKNGLVFHNGKFSRADISIVDGTIHSVGTATGDDEVIDASGMAIVPGLVNTHTHLAMTLLRGAGDDMPLHQWLSERIWPLEGNLTTKDCYWGCMMGIVEMIKTGTTCFNDMYFNMDATIDAVLETGMRARITHAVIDLGDEEKAERELKESARIERLCSDHDNLSYMMGPHAPYTCSQAFLERIRDYAADHSLGVHIHASETEREVQDSLSEHGMTPVAYLDSIGMLNERSVLAHCVHVTPEERRIMASRGVHVAHCPQSNMKLSSGRAPIQEMLTEGVSVSLGTDGAASNNNLDMTQELKAMALVHKLGSPTDVSASAALRIATQGGADALGLPVGQIVPGACADLVCIDLSHYSMRPAHDLVSNLVYALNTEAVRHVMVGGKMLMQDRTLMGLDEERICDKAAEHAKDLVEKV